MRLIRKWRTHRDAPSRGFDRIGIIGMPRMPQRRQRDAGCTPATAGPRRRSRSRSPRIASDRTPRARAGRDSHRETDRTRRAHASRHRIEASHRAAFAMHLRCICDEIPRKGAGHSGLRSRLGTRLEANRRSRSHSARRRYRIDRIEFRSAPTAHAGAYSQSSAARDLTVRRRP